MGPINVTETHRPGPALGRASACWLLVPGWKEGGPVSSCTCDTGPVPRQEGGGAVCPPSAQVQGYGLQVPELLSVSPTSYPFAGGACAWVRGCVGQGGAKGRGGPEEPSLGCHRARPAPGLLPDTRGKVASSSPEPWLRGERAGVQRGLCYRAPRVTLAVSPSRGASVVSPLTMGAQQPLLLAWPRLSTGRRRLGPGQQVCARVRPGRRSQGVRAFPGGRWGALCTSGGPPRSKFASSC